MSERRPESEAELVELIRSLEEPAPARLHESVRALVAERERERRRRLPLPALWQGAVGAAVALAAVVLVLVLGGGSGGLTLAEASALTLAPSTLPAPDESPNSSSELTANVEGTAFPYWDSRFGWKASGARIDHRHGLTIVTVFYESARGRRIGYAIVSGHRSGALAKGAPNWRAGTEYRLTSQHQAGVVTWVRDGHLCVISGRGVARSVLLALAGASEHAAS